MLKLWNYSVTSLTNVSSRDYGEMLEEAMDVCITRSINGEYKLSFRIAKTASERLKVRNNIEYNGQLFRISSVTDTDGILSVECEHIFCYDAKRVFLPSVAQGDCIGEDAYTVIDECIASIAAMGSLVAMADFKVMSEAECEALGMTRIQVNIDFETVDKVMLYDVIEQVIECAGMGELYVDNNRFAIVERIGSDTDTVISTALNMSQVSVETDTSQMITRLYPYGKDNLEITNAAANENGTDYIDSENVYAYGVMAGCIDYGDCTDTDSLLERAVWNFDAANPDRIDVPDVSINANVSGVNAELGDRVCVVYDGEIIQARIISLTRYPYNDNADAMTIGRQRKDMYFYLNQVGALARKYAGISVKNGKIRGGAISGVLKGSGLDILSASVSADEDGNLYINGKKIVTEEV